MQNKEIQTLLMKNCSLRKKIDEHKNNLKEGKLERLS